MLPTVVTYQLPAGNATTIAATQAATSLAIGLATTIVGTVQRRIVVNSTLNDTGIYFRIVGLNQANNTITELLPGAGTAAAATSNLDYISIASVTPSTLTGSIATTAGSVSVGTNAGGSSLWNIVNWHVSPVNIELSGVLVTSQGVNYTMQYTYDDPNNLPSGLPATANFPQPFNHPNLTAATTSLDASINDPVTAWRVLINSGTGTLRATGIQAGIAGP